MDCDFLVPYTDWVCHEGRPISRLSQSEVERRLLEIVRVEGPIAVPRLFRIADLKPKSRKVSIKALPLLELALDALVGRVRIGGENYPGCRIVFEAGGRRVVPRRLGSRSFEEIPITELAEVMHLSGLNIADRRALYQETLRLYGLLSQTTSSAKSLDRAYKVIRARA